MAVWLPRDTKIGNCSYSWKHMDFLPAKLAKEARNEVLTHWSGDWAWVRISHVTLGLVTQFSVSCRMSNSFSCPPCPLPFYTRLIHSTYCQHSFFFAYRLRLWCCICRTISRWRCCFQVCCLLIKYCCLLWQTNGIQCVRSSVSSRLAIVLLKIFKMKPFPNRTYLLNGWMFSVKVVCQLLQNSQ